MIFGVLPNIKICLDFKSIELFAGAGGLSLGLEDTKGTLFFCRAEK